ncbi:peroxiredoxin-5, mitochondrial isoform X2 [Microtus pennsylvanicus]|uniref:peroxiredoxin-5, mitochondrial isoform X2 n=1 Tax=Microtus pennsylvanicus TaxID=10058 RepID=UPI003F6DA0F4
MLQSGIHGLGGRAGSVLRAAANWTCEAGRASREAAGWKRSGARSFSSAAVAMAPIKVGDAIPSVEVFEGEPGKKVNLAELFKGKKGVLFGVPGAFTPGCSKTHLPGFVEQAEALKAKGVQVLACLTVNDVFVTEEWGRAHQAKGKVRLLADPTGAFGKVFHGGRQWRSEGAECGAGWHRPHLQPGLQHPLPALRPGQMEVLCCSIFPAQLWAKRSSPSSPGAP